VLDEKIKKGGLMKKSFTFLFMSLIVCTFCFAQSMQEPAVDGIYLMGTETIKFIPPQGWKTIDFDHDTILNFSPENIDSSAFLGFVFLTGGYDIIFSSRKEIDVLKDMVETMKRQPGYLTVEIINFNGFEAIKSTSSNLHGKDMQIQFFKNNKQIVVTFSAGKEEFAQLLPLVEKSFETLEFISSTK